MFKKKNNYPKQDATYRIEQAICSLIILNTHLEKELQVIRKERAKLEEMIQKLDDLMKQKIKITYV